MVAYRIGLPARLSLSSIDALERALAEAEASDATVWVLDGASPEVFCGGMDLESLATEAQGDRAVRGFARCLRALMHASRPTIAVVEGEALGGGLGLAAACDLTLASTRASVALPEALFGILPALIMPALLSRMTPQRVRLLALTGSTRPAEWAENAGLFDRVVPPERLAQADRRAQRELSRVSPETVGRLRQLVRDQSALALDAGLDEATEIAAATVADAEVRRTVARFLEEGVAPWTA